MLKSRRPIRTTGKNLVGLWRPSFVKVKNQLYVYGGGGNNITNDLHVLDLCNMRWETIQTATGIPPSRRYGHTTTLWKQYIIVFGGCNEYQAYCNDIHLFDLEKQTWHQPQITGFVTARYLHSAVIHEDKLFVYGGFAKTTDCTYVLDDVSVLDLNTFTWSTHQRVPPRYNHSATLIGHKMYIYAGKDEHGNTVSDLLMVNLNMAPYTSHLIIHGASSPIVLLKSQHFCEAVCGKLLVFGRYIESNNNSNMYHHRNVAGLSHGGGCDGNYQSITAATGGITTLSSSAIQNNNNAPESMYGLWMLDLDTFEWEQQECAFGVGGWNYFTVITENIPPTNDDQTPSVALNNLLFLGNTQFYRPQGYDHFRDALVINGESLGLYDIPPTQPIVNEFGPLLNNPELSDFVIVLADGKELHVHKVILMTRWPHFRQMYKSDMIESQQGRMQMDERFPVVWAFLQYLYTDHLDMDAPVDVVCDMLILANMYLLHRLKKMCCQRLYERHFTIDTCTTIFTSAIITDEVGLELLALDFIMKHYGTILKAELLDQMPTFARLAFLASIPEDTCLQTGPRTLVTTNNNQKPMHLPPTTNILNSAARPADRMTSVATQHGPLPSNNMVMGV